MAMHGYHKKTVKKVFKNQQDRQTVDQQKHIIC